MINVLDFENADIGRLAVHLSEISRPRPAEYIPLTVGTTAFVAYQGTGVFCGLSFTDVGGTDANTLTVHDGGDVGGPVLARVSVAASASVLVPFGAPGVLIRQGLVVVAAAAGGATLYVSRAGYADTVG